MQYQLKEGIVKSENAAKSHLQKSKYLSELILAQSGRDKVLDFGCGKLRYFGELNKIARELYLHDSKIQLERVQTIINLETSVVDFVKRKRNCDILEKEKFRFHSNSFHFVLCSNVISAIPWMSARTKCITDIKMLLNKDGIALFVCQYRNTYFNGYQKRKGAVKCLDGWLYRVNGSLFFYGLTSPDSLKSLIESNGLFVVKQIIREGSVYIFAGKRKVKSA
jgi:hypothetical protein